MLKSIKKQILLASVLVLPMSVFAQAENVYRESPYVVQVEDATLNKYVKRITELNGMTMVWNSVVDIPIENRHTMNDATSMSQVFNYHEALYRAFLVAMQVNVGFVACQRDEAKTVEIIDHSSSIPHNCNKIVSAMKISTQPATVEAAPKVEAPQGAVDAPASLPPMPLAPYKAPSGATVTPIPGPKVTEIKPPF